jgi:hypothetical protein
LMTLMTASVKEAMESNKAGSSLVRASSISLWETGRVKIPLTFLRLAVEDSANMDIPPCGDDRLVTASSNAVSNQRSIASLVKECMSTWGLNMSQLSRVSGIGDGQLSMYLSGKTKTATARIHQKLIFVLNMHKDDVVEASRTRPSGEKGRSLS